MWPVAHASRPGKRIDHDPPLVFDLEADPGESTPLDAASIPDVLDRVRAAFDAFWADVNSTMRSKTNFGKNEASRPCSNPRSTCCRL